MLKLLKKKKEQKEFFLSLLLKPNSIGAVLTEKLGQNLVVQSSKEEEQEKNVAHLTAEELTEEADKVISAVEAYVPKEYELEKTVFSVPYDWMEEAKIKREYLHRLKKLSDLLALTPIGFIVSIEAIIHALQQKEGAPLSAIFIERTKHDLYLYTVKSGSVVEYKKAKIEETLVETVEKTLSNLSLEVLPSRILLLDHEGVEEVQQDFLSHTWSETLPFLHIPQVSVLDKGFENESIVKGVGAQLGLDVVFDGVPHEEFSEEVNEIKQEEVDQNVEIVSMEELGFAKDQDIVEEAAVQEEIIGDEEPVVTVHENSSQTFENVEERELDVPSSSSPKKSLLPSFSLPGIFLPSKGFLSEIKSRPGLVAIPIVFVLFFAGVGFVNLQFLEKATVVVFAESKSVQKETDILLSQEADPNAIDPILPLGVITKEIEIESNTETTGEKETGEKATGEVTVFNKTEKEKIFKKGEVLEGTNNLKFVLMEEVTVASTSAFSTEFSSKKVKVEAAEFGKEYNLPSKTNFEFDDFPASSYFARNDNALNGGTKQTAQVVSQDDLDALEESIVEDARVQAIEQAQSEVTSGQVLLDEPLSFEVSSSKYSKKVGEEAKEVSVAATVVFEFGVYNQKDLENLVRGMSDNPIPQEYVYDQERSSISLSDVEVDTNEASGRLSIDAYYIPKIESEEMVPLLTGKSKSGAEKEIGGIEGVRDVQIQVSGAIPFFSNWLPRNAKNITIDVKSE